MNLKLKKQLSEVGIIDISEIIYNPSYQLLYNEEQDIQLTGFEKVQDTEFGAVNVMTGVYTGRSPKDKYIVKDQTTEDKLWWTNEISKNDNKPIDIKSWKELKGKVTNQLSNKKLYVVDAFCGANQDTRLQVRFVMEVAWQAHFVKNMFIRPSDKELKDFGIFLLHLGAAPLGYVAPHRPMYRTRATSDHHWLHREALVANGPLENSMNPRFRLSCQLGHPAHEKQSSDLHPRPVVAA